MNNAEVLIKFKGDATEAEKAQDQLQKDFENLQSKGETALLGIAAATDIMVTALLSTGVKYNAEIETYLTRLETLTGSADEANSILEQIKKDALATPFEVSSLTQAESLLLSTGLSAEEARADILALGDAIAASGGGNAELSRMAVNLQQIKNVGKASALDIKQFAYAGIDIYGLLADSIGTTREEASKMDVTYDMLSKALQKASKDGGKYYGAMQKQSKTYNGAMSNFKEAVGVFAGAVSEDLFGALQKVIPPLTDLLNWLTKNKDMVIAIAGPVLTFINVLAGFLIVQKVTKLFKVLWAVLMGNPIGLIIAGISALVVAIVTLYNKCEWFRNFVNKIFDGIKTGIKAVVDFVKPIVQSIWEFIKPIVEKVWEIIKKLIDNAIAKFTLVKERAQEIFGSIKGIFQGFINFITGVFTGNWEKAWQGVKDIFSNIFSGLFNIFKTPLNWIIDGINVFIRGLNKIKIPSWVPGIGGKGFNIGEIPRLNVGTNFVPEDTLAMIHKGEAVVPKKFNPYANGVNSQTLGMSGISPVINVYVDVDTDPIGQVVSNIKTFSGGAKNDFNYGQGV
jgi:tape measure domain-containing protein